VVRECQQQPVGGPRLYTRGTENRRCEGASGWLARWVQFKWRVFWMATWWQCDVQWTATTYTHSTILL